MTEGLMDWSFLTEKNKGKDKKMKNTSMGCGVMCLGIVGLMIVLVVSVLGFSIGQINSLRTIDEACSSELAEIDNQLERKDKLIPNLVSTVKGYAKHEEKIMSNIAEARSKLLNAKTTESRLEANDGLSHAIGRLMMITENYPDLKADKQFIALQDQLEGTENRITVARMDYNKAAKMLNTRIRTYPSAFFVGFSGVEKRQYLEASEKAKANQVNVSFE